MAVGGGPFPHTECEFEYRHVFPRRQHRAGVRQANDDRADDVSFVDSSVARGDVLVVEFVDFKIIGRAIWAFPESSDAGAFEDLLVEIHGKREACRFTVGSNAEGDTDGTTDFTGILLTAETTGFGFLDLGAGLPDLFDALLTVTGGTLTGIGGGFAVGQTIGATIFAEQSLFTGVFTQSFNATKVKSDVAPTPEPGTLLLLGFGAASLGLGLRKRRK